ncbi:hypothetical protein CIG2463D_1357 [Campylobacter iguaniorum]|uniref:hypothetical protein n=1 Tax=Campylobacter iguaniorum TaxID=1244531 RepID=UPI00073A0C2F|nr:hypothetical protein [Campylobacter iguaniorum]ALV24925.1 hypothetical protein CIG2463D_1357 [Campylobacter iguaniorum]
MAEITTDQILNLDSAKLVSDYKTIESSMVDENSIYAKTINFMTEEFNKSNLSPKDKLTLQANLLSQMSITLTAKAVDAALQMQQVASQLNLSNAEIEFNKARTKLVEAQTETEKEKKNAVLREIASYDDQLRIKEADNLTNAVFAHASGGVTVPADMMTKMLNAIDKITPNNE